jgi:hypothetical protein
MSNFYKNSENIQLRNPSLSFLGFICVKDSSENTFESEGEKDWSG